MTFTVLGFCEETGRLGAGIATYSLKLSKKGLRSIKVTYAGSSTVDSAKSTTRKIRVR